jgi:hypothetical protein
LYSQPSIKDIGIDYLGERLGGCQRALWYQINDVAPTDEEKDHLVVADYLNEPIKKVLLDKIAKVVRPFIVEPYGWYIPTGNRNIWCYLDGIVINPTSDVCTGILIFVGSGYGFRSEVFGTKQKAGAIKDNHLVQAWTTMLLFPDSGPRRKTLDKIEVIYYDRGQLDAVSYVVDSCPIQRSDIIQSIATASGPNTPSPSFERVWSSREKVARLYASKKLSKEKYETWMESGIGGDWQCQYCPFLTQCTKDGN